MNRLIAIRFGICLALTLVYSSELSADNPRETPIVRAVKKAKASVVNIHTEKTTYSADSLFNSKKDRKVNGMGTGIIIDPRGYIVTNYHVVNGVDPESLRVTLFDGHTFLGKKLASDPLRDLALIKIETTQDLQVMPLGTSSDLMLGETVIAVGNAYGYEHTVTCGIVSYLSRDVEVNEKQSYENLIQTDASINPGNSGGPLLNLNGEVIGINVAIRQGAQRIGFAIPIDSAREVIATMMNQSILETYHGMIAHDVKTATLKQLIVDNNLANSPAEIAGLQKGDIILKANNVSIHDQADFERSLIDIDAGNTLALEISRNNQTMNLSLALQKKPDHLGNQNYASTNVSSQEIEPIHDQNSWDTLGLKLAPLQQSEKSKLTGFQYRGGLKVLKIRNNSPAAKYGIQAGDILVGLHIWETTSGDDINYILKHPQLKQFNPMRFHVHRDGQTLFGHLRLNLNERLALRNE